MKKSIFTAASPNTQAGDAFLAFRLLFQPWKWNSQKNTTNFMNELAEYLGVKHAVAIDSGRSALQIALESLGITQGDEVVTPSFTCVVVPDAIFWAKGKSTYLDSNLNDFNSDYSNISKLITQKTKAVLVQHTFGKMVNVDQIKNELAKINRTDIKIIEDFAHTLKKDQQLQGNLGFVTFGIEKVISSVRGGAIITNDEQLAAQLKLKTAALPSMPVRRIFISLANPVFWWFAIPLHSVGFGRFSVGALIRTVWRKLGFLGIMVEKSENYAIKPNWFPAKMPGVLAILGLKQLRKLEKYNQHRTKIAAIYHKYLRKISDSEDFDFTRVYLRYPILLSSVEERIRVWNLARKLKFTLGNWFSIPLYGSEVAEVTYRKLNYDSTKTPNTLKNCDLVLNLPTSINVSEARAEELAKSISQLIQK